MTTLVSVNPRVIAAGIAEDPVTKKRMVRLTLALLPGEKREGRISVDLQRWPEAIEKLLDGSLDPNGTLFDAKPEAWEIHASLAVKEVSGRPRPNAETAVRLKPDKSRISRLMGDGRPGSLVDAVTRLWDWTMREGAGVPEGIWSGLAEVISEAGKSHNRGRTAQHGVAGVGRAEAAFVLTAQRAEAALIAAAGRRPAEIATVRAKVPGPFNEHYNQIDSKSKDDIGKDVIDRQRKSILQNEELSAALTQAEAARSAVADDRALYLGRDSLIEAVDALSGFRLCPGSANDGGCTPAGRSPKLALEQSEVLLRLLRGLHRAATAPDDDQTVPAPTGLAETPRTGEELRKAEGTASHREVASQLLFALRANPTLSRLFRFVVDIEIDASDLITKLKIPEGSSDGRTPFFAFLACTLGSTDASDMVWTVTKLDYRGPTIRHVWPALREDMELHLAAPDGLADVRRKVVSQSNGLVCLGQAIGEGMPGEERRRFDLVTVDPAFAIEANVRLADRPQDLADSARRAVLPGSNSLKVDAVVPKAESPPLITRGLCIVDRWRHLAVVSEIVNAHTFAALENRPTVVDAEDLAIGYRVHIGVWAGASNVSWRGLMTRLVDYKAVGPHAFLDIEAALERLGLRKGSERRLVSDSASVAVPSRTRYAKDSATGVWIHVEELIAAWEGDPLAINCRTETVEVRAGSDLAISRTFALDLPGRERPHALRFGRSYQTAVGVVWLGGVSVPRAEVEALAGADGALRLPVTSRPTEVNAVRRFLRHEPIRPPVLLLPVGFADREDRYVRQTGPVAVLRAPRPGEKDQDSLSWRVILPPRLALDEVVRHGVLDRDEVAKPRGAFENVNIDAEWQDFPIYGRPKGEPDPGQGLPSKARLKPLRPGTPPKRLENGKAVVDERVKRIPPDEPGEPVFMAGGRTDRKHPYWPDPAAEQLVIALRPVKRPADSGYFAGEPIIVDVVAAPDRFREAVPVVLAFKRIGKTRATPLEGDVTHAMLVPKAPSTAYTDGRRLETRPFANAVRVQCVTVELYAGEHVSADCWFAPRAAALRRWFDLPETIVAVHVARDPAETAVASRLDEKLLEPVTLKGISMTPVVDRLASFDAVSAKLLKENELAEKRGKEGKLDPMSARWIAAAGIEVSARLVAAVADVLSERARARPVPQLAGVLTIEAVHAVNEPVRKPAFDRSPANLAWEREHTVLAVTRYEVLAKDDAPDSRASLLRTFQAALGPGRKPSGWPAKEPEEGATGLLLAGTIQVDLDTCAQLEVLADVVSPQGGSIDDLRRRRPVEDRLLGYWPKDAETGQTARARSLFGFEVAQDGRVTLPTSQVTLLRIDGLDAWTSNSRFAGLDSVDLASEQLKALSRTPSKLEAGPRITAYDPFKDTLARKLRLSLRVTARQSELVRRIVPDEKVQLIEELEARSSVSSDAAPDPAGLQATDVEIWLPATRRPSQPAVHAVLPSFYWTQAPVPFAGCVSDVRETRVRIWLQRPWFSAGEGERLGIVLWPPRLFGLDTDKLASGHAPRQDVPEGGWMDLEDFSDDMLGPGGKFVTRWGADPIRDAPATLGPFMSASAFKDLTGGDNAEGMPAYVPSVEIPIVTEGSSSGGTAPFATLTAALITYEPRFHVVSEFWYVDVALNPGVASGFVEPFVRFGLVRYQPHAVRGLNASTPDIAWGQVLPRREVKAWRETEPAPETCERVKVQITGPMSSRRDEYGVRVARMQVSLLEAQTVSGLVSEKELAVVEATRGPPYPETTDQGEAWIVSMTVPRSACDGDLIVLIEEEEPFLGTDDEPVLIEDEVEQAPTARFSGPRFVSKVTIPRRGEEGQGAAAPTRGPT
jgi:hypothetical protein